MMRSFKNVIEADMLNPNKISIGDIVLLRDPEDNSYTKVVITSKPNFSNGDHWVIYDYYSKPDFRGILKTCCIDDLYKCPTNENVDGFSWDKTVPTFSVPRKNKNGEWFIEVDSSRPYIFKECVKTYTEFGQLFLLYAIVPKAENRFVGKYASINCNLYIPVKCEQTILEVTHKDIEEKFGCKIKIKGE